MTIISEHARIEMRVDIETKNMAERASIALGCSSLTEFITRLIHENAPEILKRQIAIELTNTQFDKFMAICEDSTVKLSRPLIDAAKKLDKEGY